MPATYLNYPNNDLMMSATYLIYPYYNTIMLDTYLNNPYHNIMMPATYLYNPSDKYCDACYKYNPVSVGVKHNHQTKYGNKVVGLG